MMKTKWIATALCAVAMTGVGCKKEAAKSGAASGVTFTTVDMANSGTISGTIHFNGKAPQRVQIDMAQDPACSMADTNMTEQYLVKNGGLANVFVEIKDGLGNKAYAAPSDPVVMDQKGCKYVPHVIGVMAGQPVKFNNSDPTMHNVHMTPTIGTNQGVDISEPPNGAGEMRTMSTAELMIPVRCNNHPWMEAFINVASNPFYSVSDADGHFTIKGVPPGTYTILADHEKMGPKTATVTVVAHQTATLDFTYDSPQK
jgi:plastocyanin